MKSIIFNNTHLNLSFLSTKPFKIHTSIDSVKSSSLLEKEAAATQFYRLNCYIKDIESAVRTQCRVSDVKDWRVLRINRKLFDFMPKATLGGVKCNAQWKSVIWKKDLNQFLSLSKPNQASKVPITINVYQKNKKTLEQKPKWVFARYLVVKLFELWNYRLRCKMWFFNHLVYLCTMEVYL